MTAVLQVPSGKRHFKIATAPVQVAQIQWELDSLMALFRARKPARTLEIGTFCGGTLYHFLANAADFTVGATIVTVDNLEAAPDNRHLYPDWTPPGVHCIPIIGNSHDEETFEQVAEHGPFDFIFIDGLHTYDAVEQDWNDYKQLAAPGAVVAFHDICLVRDYPETGETAGVSKLWREIQAQGYLTQEIVCQPGQSEYGIGVVYL